MTVLFSILSGLSALASMLCCALSTQEYGGHRSLRSRQALRGSSVIFAGICVFLCTRFLSLPLAFPLAVMWFMVSAFVVGLLMAWIRPK